MDRPKVLVTGSNGQLGNELKDLAIAHPSFDFIFLSRNQLSIDQLQNVQQVVAQLKPQFIINCAAFTAVDKAESDKEGAMAINATAVGYLAAAAKQHNTRFIHISTDYVFDGSSQVPLKEDDAVLPVNFYGISKLAGEVAAIAANADSIIIRTSWVYSAYGNNFVKTMMRLMQQRTDINVVADQTGSPTYAADLAELVVSIIEKKEWHPGVYHFSNDGIITWKDFADAIKKLNGYSCEVHAITTDQFPTPARRPLYSVMDKTKVIQTFGLQLKPWEISLQRCLEKMRNIT